MPKHDKKVAEVPPELTPEQRHAQLEEGRRQMEHRQQQAKFNQFLQRRPIPGFYCAVMHYVRVLNEMDKVRRVHPKLKLMNDDQIYHGVSTGNIGAIGLGLFSPNKEVPENAIITIKQEYGMYRAPIPPKRKPLTETEEVVRQIELTSLESRKEELQQRMQPLYQPGIVQRWGRLNVDPYFRCLQIIQMNDRKMLMEKMMKEMGNIQIINSGEGIVPMLPTEAQQPTEEVAEKADIEIAGFDVNVEPDPGVEPPPLPTEDFSSSTEETNIAEKINQQWSGAAPIELSGTLRATHQFVPNEGNPEMAEVDQHLEKLEEVNAAFADPIPGLIQVETKPLPASVDLSGHLPAVKDQGGLASSSAHAVVAGLEAAEGQEKQGTTLLYYNEKNVDGEPQ